MSGCICNEDGPHCIHHTADLNSEYCCWCAELFEGGPRHGEHVPSEDPTTPRPTSQVKTISVGTSPSAPNTPQSREEILEEKLSEAGRKLQEHPRAGHIYSHFKGGLYKIMAVARHSENEELLVVYRALRGGKMWARPLEMFNDAAPPSGKLLRLRFTLLTPTREEVEQAQLRGKPICPQCAEIELKSRAGWNGEQEMYCPRCRYEWCV